MNPIWAKLIKIRPLKLNTVLIITNSIIAFATLGNVIIAILMWNITGGDLEINKEIFSSTYRPFLGIEEISSEIDVNKKIFMITLVLKNFGTVPAKNVDANWRAFVDDKNIPGTEIPHDFYTVFPNNHMLFKGGIPIEHFDNLLSEKSKLIITFRATYEGIEDRQYVDYEKCVFDPQISTFIFIEGDWE